MLDLFSKADRLLDIAFRWGTLLGLLTTGFAWLASRMTVFDGLNWADFLALGIAAALITVFLLAAALAQFRKFRPLNITAAGEVPLPDPDDGSDGEADVSNEIESLSGRLARLEQSLAKERDLDVPIPPTREEIVSRLGALANQMRPLWSEYCRKQAAALETLIAERRPRKPGSADPIVTMIGVEERIMRGMTVLGISAAQRQAAQDTAVSHIRSNALYCSLAPEDQGIWDDPTKKQAWYAADAKWEADLKLIRGARPSD